MHSSFYRGNTLINWNIEQAFKSLKAAKNILASIELMHMIRKDPSYLAGSEKMPFADQFYALAGKNR